MKKRILAALLSAAMAVTLFAGCSTPKTSDEGESSEGGSSEKVFRYATRYSGSVVKTNFYAIYNESGECVFCL